MIAQLALSFFIFFIHIMVLADNVVVKIVSEEDLAQCVILEDGQDISGSDAYIRKIILNDTVYILKQINEYSLDDQFLLINDCIASTIGWQAGIPVNNVAFIPYNVGSTIKKYPERAATLHTYSAGIDLEKELPGFLPPSFNMRQAINTKWNKNYWVPHKQQGLARSIIESMQAHKDLCLLAALDTFVGNSDRSFPNIFYDRYNDVFYGIDHAAAFSKKSALYATQRLNELLLHNYFNRCDYSVLSGLRVYYTALLDLYTTYEPSAVIESMRVLVPHLGLNAGSSPEVYDRISFHTRLVEKNYKYTLQFLQLLESI